MRGYKAAIAAALGRGLQALTEWIEGFRQHRRANGRRLSPRPLVGFGGRRGLRQRGWLWGCRVELSQRRAQRVEARGVGKPVVFDGAPDCRIRGCLAGL